MSQWSLECCKRGGTASRSRDRKGRIEVKGAIEKDGSHDDRQGSSNRGNRWERASGIDELKMIMEKGRK